MNFQRHYVKPSKLGGTTPLDIFLVSSPGMTPLPCGIYSLPQRVDQLKFLLIFRMIPGIVPPCSEPRSSQNPFLCQTAEDITKHSPTCSWDLKYILLEASILLWSAQLGTMLRHLLWRSTNCDNCEIAFGTRTPRISRKQSSTCTSNKPNSLSKPLMSH